MSENIKHIVTRKDIEVMSRDMLPQKRYCDEIGQIPPYKKYTRFVDFPIETGEQS